MKAMKVKKTTWKEQELLNTLWKTAEAFYKALFKQCSALEKALTASEARQQKLEEHLAAKKSTVRKRTIGKKGAGRPKGSKNVRRVSPKKIMEIVTGTHN